VESEPSRASEMPGRRSTLALWVIRCARKRVSGITGTSTNRRKRMVSLALNRDPVRFLRHRSRQ
jgi:hypothetical protein